MTETVMEQRETLPEFGDAQPALPMGAGEAELMAAKIRGATNGLVNQLGRLRALAVEFYERRGHIALGYSTIEECAKREFGWHRVTFWRALQTATIERSLGVEVGTLPGSHAAALARLPAAERAEAYAAAGDGATAADVRREVEARRQPAQEAELLPPYSGPIEAESKGLQNAGEERHSADYEEPARTEPVTGAATVNITGRGVTPETGGVIPPAVAPGRAESRDSVGFSASGHSQDRPTHETAGQETVEADYSSMEERCRPPALPDLEEEWLIAVLERGWLLENGLPTPRLVKLARIVVARAMDSTRAGMVARAFLTGAKS